MTNNCNVARDLMPLVIDGVASEESQQYVDEHIAECTECALTYGAMRVELPRASQERERAEMEKTAKKLRRKRILRGVVGGMVGIVIFLLCYVSAPKLQEWYAQQQTVNEQKKLEEKYVCENGYLSLEALYYDVSRSAENMHARVQVDILSFPSGNLPFNAEHKAVPVNDNTGICVQYHIMYAPDDPDAGAGGFYWTGRIEDGVWLQFADGLRDENGMAVSLPIVRIELHAGDSVVVLWEEGDVLQTPAEAKAKREAEEAKYATK